MLQKKSHGFSAGLLAASAILAIASLSPGSASAVTLSLDNATHSTPLPGGGNGYSLPVIDGIGVGSTVYYYGAGDTGGLKVDANATLKFEFLGTEAGFNNLAVFNVGAFQMENHGTHDPVSFTTGSGFLPFYFQANLPSGTDKANNGGTINSNLLLGFAQVSSTVFLVFFDDGGGGPPSDKDFDDFVLRVTAACPVDGCPPPGGPGTETPLPAAVWLFGTVLAGGMGVNRWRKKRDARSASGRSVDA